MINPTFQDVLRRFESAAEGATRGNDQHLLEEGLVALGGFFWYRCVIDSDSASFGNGDRSRSGWSFFNFSVVEGRGVDLHVYGLRLASSKHEGPNLAIEKPISWQGKGHLTSSAVGFQFIWKSTGREQGENSETVLIDSLTKLWPGTFTHVTSAGVEVRGSVKYQRIETASKVPSDEGGMPWLSSEIAPRFRDFLPIAQIAAWGKRLYERLQAEEKANVAEPLVYIDVVSRQHQRTSDAGLLETAQRMIEINPNATLFLARKDNEPLASLGPVK
jgi:hypothetical protein